ncbi:ASCH domain-containing protein [Pseudomonas cremoricolorata]|uniref:ASCH domain-containing protein n=1 Tax=Pseudomonas cremoricolorata TaxID=157783 RepID=UPI00040BA9A3|nr:ASCH domain-containing protein [Pseudomonas cremoricolorata]
MQRTSQEVTIKALSIVHPGGMRIACGEKTLEIRRWAPELQPDEDLLIVENRRFLHVDGEQDGDGRAVAVVRVKAVRPFVEQDIAAACASYHEPGWLAWELSDVRPVSHAEPVLAARGIYDVQLAPQPLPLDPASVEHQVQVAPIVR